MTQLRAGFESNDPRLDRIPMFDQRSRNYPVRALLAPQQAAKPRSYTWTVPAWLDQGQEGACVGFAWAHELWARPTSTPATARYARQRIYWEAQKLDPWAGGAYPDASPKYEGTAVLAGAKVVQREGHITEYRWALGLDDLILAVGYKGPAVLGLNWYTGMFDTDSDGYLHVTGREEGGHAILCNAVNLKRGAFRLHNSWGKGWGDGGEAWISFEDMDRLLRENGEACIPVKRKKAEAED